MAGLMNRGPTTAGNMPMRSEALAAGAPTAGPGEGTPGDESNVSPEEQAQYDDFVDKGLQLIYDDKAMPQVLQILRGDGDPKEGLANAAVMIVMRLEDSARQAGKQLSQDVIYHGGVEILEDLANLSKESGIHSFTDQDREGALYQALDIYRSMRQQQGTLHQEEIEQDFAEILEADRAGQLGAMLPGAEQHFSHGKPKGKQ